MTIRATSSAVQSVNGQTGPVVLPLSSSTQVITPLAEDSIIVNAGIGTLIVTPAGTLATLTISLPATCTAFGNRITILSSQALTLLTLTGIGTTIVGPITTLALGAFATYVLNGTVWYRCG